MMENEESTDHNPNQRHGSTSDEIGPGATEGGLDGVQGYVPCLSCFEP